MISYTWSIYGEGENMDTRENIIGEINSDLSPSDSPCHGLDTRSTRTEGHVNGAIVPSLSLSVRRTSKNETSRYRLGSVGVRGIPCKHVYYISTEPEHERVGTPRCRSCHSFVCLDYALFDSAVTFSFIFVGHSVGRAKHSSWVQCMPICFAHLCR